MRTRSERSGAPAVARLLVTMALVILAAATLRPTPSAAGTPEVGEASYSLDVDQVVRYRDFFPLFNVVLNPSISGSAYRVSTLFRSAQADPRQLGAGNLRGNVRLNRVCFDSLGREINLPNSRIRLNRWGAGGRAVEVSSALDCTFWQVEGTPRGRRRLGPGLHPTQITTVQRLPSNADGGCFQADTLCLQNGRFQVDVEWRNTLGGRANSGFAMPRTDDSAIFYLLDPDNTELLIKIIDACDSPSNRFWVFAAGLTNVETTIRVEDTLANEANVYTNPLNTPFQPIQDTNAFATCP